jgi:hypothetical protein
MTFLARDEFAFVGERATGDGSALFGQLFEPIVPVVHDP